jgi:cysteinyl-tRNA synthetase
MPIRIYNTLTRKKEPFEPIEPGKVRMYVCGPTVYDSSHIGHARSVVVFDVIVRYLRAMGDVVTYVRNFTDVDDKIINRANQLGVDPRELAEKYIREFHQDMDSLNVQRPTVEPKATEHIGEIVHMIELLLKREMAYQVDGDVYFAVDAYTGYGKLSGRRLEDMEAGARVEVDARKRNPFDFALWKSAKPGEPSWKSPWGEGRPGWHIECSAMSMKYLGDAFDIHGGGKDLVFPHHENEIAQSEGAMGKGFVKYWMHNGFVNINQEKMSKSLGNFLLIRDVIRHHHPEAVRIFLLSNHYRSPVDFTEKAMEEAAGGLEKLYTFLERLEAIAALTPGSGYESAGEWWERFCEAMDDDFNTARALGILFESVRSLNRLLDEEKEPFSPHTLRALSAGRSDMLRMGGVLGILNRSARDYFENRKVQALRNQGIDPDQVEGLIRERAEARNSKNWAEADRIRKKLAEWNILVEDRAEGTIWKFKN